MENTEMSQNEHKSLNQDTDKRYDVIIIGAGLSGIGAAHHLIKKCPSKSYCILEGRAKMGGTWDLFKYPGIRSDSDMYTLGYSFKPWPAAEAIADGGQILDYINETAKERNIDQHILYNQRVKKANWDNKSSQWQLKVSDTAQNKVISYNCNFIINCTGYYNYENGYTPDFKGIENYEGQVVHPQKWTPDISYQDKKIVVIGSGATAVTLVPELAEKAEKVYMLQRSPTYIITVPTKDGIANFLKKWLPAKTAHFLNKWKNVTSSLLFYKLCKNFPNFSKKLITAGVKKSLGEKHFEQKHFDPSYNPWDQRVCMVPDNDLFKTIKKGQAEIVTDHISHFTKDGIKLESGAEIQADLVVTATGLQLLFAGGIDISIDDQKVKPADLMIYRGTMLSGVPNFAIISGYTNASWTLKSDLTSEYACRIINHLDRTKTKACIPTVNTDDFEIEPLIDFNSGYVLRSIQDFPKQGSRKPWKLFQSYPRDMINFRYSSLKDKALIFK